MFNQKRKTLFAEPVTTQEKATQSNPFLAASAKEAAKTLSGNAAPKFSTTGNDFLDQFANMGTYRKERSYDDISRDCVTLWNQDPETFVKFLLYTRLVSRKVKLADGYFTTAVQKGQGLKHESIMRMIWLHVEHPDAFWNNFRLFVGAGSWRDIFQMLAYDLLYNTWDGRVLDWNKFSQVIQMALVNDEVSDLVKKYLPQIRAKSKCKTVRSQARTILAKWIASELGISYKEYRKLKTSGTAHDWQKCISQQKLVDFDFGAIHGRALMLLANSKFLENQGLTGAYDEWISDQPVAKFTGYVHELAANINPTMKAYQYKTVNKQYDGLVELAKKDSKVQTGLLVVRDTSGSMRSAVPGYKFSAGDVAKSLGIFFGDLLEGPFKNAWMEFHSTVKMHFYKESNFVDKWRGDRSNYIGSTNFIGVADHFVSMLKKVGSENQFPTGILCISDGEFNRSGKKTNAKEFRKRLKKGGFSKDYVDNFKIVLWDIRNSYYGKRDASFETFGTHKNMFYISGYDGSVITFLMGGKDKPAPSTAEELFEAAMDQELMSMVKI